MELLTVSNVSKQYGISTRMLSYYEQNGLLTSRKKEGYSYRVYDETAIRRLQQIIILRKLQIPIKQIKLILTSPDAAVAIDIFEKSIHELDKNIVALSTIRKILQIFVSELEKIAKIKLNLDFMHNDSVLELSANLALAKQDITNVTMANLTQAARTLDKLDNARVIHLPPMTVAAYRHIGEDPKKNAAKIMDEFVRSSGLLQHKPDTRQLGFDHQTGENYDGYEMLVSIPDDWDVPEPLVKKRLRGGMYVTALDVNWYDYKRVYAWITDSDKYQYDGDFTRIEPPLIDIPSFAGLEFNLLEHLNYYNNVQNPSINPDDVQWEMLFPIKPYVLVEESPVEIPDSVEKCGQKAWLVHKNKIELIGFTQILQDSDVPANFAETLNKFRKPGAPILRFHSSDYEADHVDGSRVTDGLLSQDVTDMEALMALAPFVQRIDASKWVVFEYATDSNFHTGDNVHIASQKLGYKFNCDIITGVMTEYPDGKVEGTVYDWYPVR